MFSQLEINEINRSFRAALASYNSNAKEKVVDSKATFSTCAQYLRSEGVDQSSWNHQNIWAAAILAVHAQLEKVPVKTQAQINQEKESADRKDGRGNNAKYRPKQKEPVKGNLDDAFKAAQENLQKLFTPESKPPVEKKAPLQGIPVDKDFVDMDKAERAAFKKLSSDSIRLWMQKRAEWVRQNLPQQEE